MACYKLLSFPFGTCWNPNLTHSTKNEMQKQTLHDNCLGVIFDYNYTENLVNNMFILQDVRQSLA